MSRTISVGLESYTLESCIACGCNFLFPTVLFQTAQIHKGPNGKQIYCPNGHSFHYTGETEEQKLRRERDRLVQEQARLADTISGLRESNALKEKRIVKLTKRANAGACPCCKRSFQNMARHMATKHPDFAKPKAVA